MCRATHRAAPANGFDTHKRALPIPDVAATYLSAATAFSDIGSAPAYVLVGAKQRDIALDL